MNWVDAAKGKTAASCPFEYAAKLTEVMLLGVVALKAGTEDRLRRREHARHQRAGREPVSGARAARRVVALEARRIACGGAASLMCRGRVRPVDPDAGFWFDDIAFALPAPAAETARRPAHRPRAGLESRPPRAPSSSAPTRAFSIRVADDHPRSGASASNGRCARAGPLPNAGESLSLRVASVSSAPCRSTSWPSRRCSTRRRRVASDGPRRHRTRHRPRRRPRVRPPDLSTPPPSTTPHDENSYEYPTPDRAAQYYGDLHWSTARPRLEQRLR